MIGLKKSLSKLQQEHQAQSITLQQLQEEAPRAASEFEGQIAFLKKEQESLETVNATVMDENRELEIEVRRLREEHALLSLKAQQLSSAENTIQRLQRESAESYRKFSTEVANLRGDHEKQLDRLAQEKLTLAKELKDEFQSSLSRSEETMQQLRGQLDEAHARENELATELASMRTQRNNDMLEMQKLQTRFDQQEQKLERETNQNRSDMEKVRSQLETSHKQVLLDLEEFHKQSLADLEAEQEGLKKELQQMKSSRDDLEKEIDEQNRRHQQEERAWNAFKSKLQESKQFLTDQKTQLSEEVRRLTEENLRLADEVEVLGGRLNASSSTHKEDSSKMQELARKLEQARVKCDQTAADLADSEAKRQHLSDQMCQLASEKAALSAAAANHQQELDELRQETSSKAEELEEVADKMEVMRSEEEMLKREVRQLTAMKDKLARNEQKLHRDIAELRASNSKLEAELVNLRDQQQLRTQLQLVAVASQTQQSTLANTDDVDGGSHGQMDMVMLARILEEMKVHLARLPEQYDASMQRMPDFLLKRLTPLLVTSSSGDSQGSKENGVQKSSSEYVDSDFQGTAAAAVPGVRPQRTSSTTAGSKSSNLLQVPARARRLSIASASDELESYDMEGSLSDVGELQGLISSLEMRTRRLEGDAYKRTLSDVSAAEEEDDDIVDETEEDSQPPQELWDKVQQLLRRFQLRHGEQVQVIKRLQQDRDLQTMTAQTYMHNCQVLEAEHHELEDIVANQNRIKARLQSLLQELLRDIHGCQEIHDLLEEWGDRSTSSVDSMVANLREELKQVSERVTNRTPTHRALQQLRSRPGCAEARVFF